MVAADRELIDNLRFRHLQALYDAQATRMPIPNIWADESEIGRAAAIRRG
jgi:hypothetical protein